MSKIGKALATIVMTPIIAFGALIGGGYLLGYLTSPRPVAEAQIEISDDESKAERIASDAPLQSDAVFQEIASAPVELPKSTPVAAPEPETRERPAIQETPSGGTYWTNNGADTEDAMLTLEYILRENFSDRYTLDVIGSDFYVYVWDEAITEAIENDTYDPVDWNYIKNQVVYCGNAMTYYLQSISYWHNCTIDLCNDETHSKSYLLVYNGNVDYDFRRGWDE